MPFTRLLLVGAGVFALALPAAAQAGTVTGSAGVSNTYQGTDAEDSVALTVIGGQTVFGVTGVTFGGTGPCTAMTDEVQCTNAPTVVVNGLGAGDRIDGSALPATTSLQADGGAGGDELLDGAANDTLSGGPGDDRWFPGRGADVFTGGDGDDTVYYSDRTGAVTIRLNGAPVSGEAGENDTIGADVEGAYGGSGNDSIVGNGLGNRLYGGGGNDSIVGGTAEDRVEGNEGDDVIDTRDGRYDSVDCGPGNDTLYADPGDGATNCEIAPDRDGDGTLNEQDCGPDNPAIHPGAGEIVGNNVDEDCAGGPQYLRVSATVGYSATRRGNSAKFIKLTVNEIRRGDTIELRCTGGKSKGCPFSKKAQTGKSKAKINLLPLLKQRYLKRNAVLEVRVTRPNEIGRVVRLKVGKRGAIKSEPLCLAVGAAKPSKCS